MTSIPLYTELEQLASQREWSDRDLDWRNYILIINSLPDCLTETIYVLIIHYYLTHSHSSPLGITSNDVVEIPYLGSATSGPALNSNLPINNKGIFFRCSQFPLPLKQILITYIQSIIQASHSVSA